MLGMVIFFHGTIDYGLLSLGNIFRHQFVLKKVYQVQVVVSRF